MDFLAPHMVFLGCDNSSGQNHAAELVLASGEMSNTPSFWDVVKSCGVLERFSDAVRIYLEKGFITVKQQLHVWTVLEEAPACCVGSYIGCALCCGTALI